MPTLRQQLDVRAEQRMTLLPRMLQSIEILQLATIDLLALIDRELEQNETLESVDSDRGAQEIERGADPSDEDPKLAYLHSIPAREMDLLESVRQQVGLLELDESLVRGVLMLAERLDDRGFLTGVAADFRAAVGDDVFDTALAILQRLEPRGLGASGPIEAILLQIDETDPDRELIAALLDEHLDEIARNRLPDVAAALEIQVGDVEELLARVARLEPQPARGFRDESEPAIRADVIVRTTDGRSEVVVDDLALPVLSVNQDYVRMSQDRTMPREVRTYLGGKLRSARELITAVEHRQRTLCTVAAAILAEQSGFLRRGRRAIRPLRMSAIAERVGLHTSTVSRAIAGKFLGCEHGVIALRAFFDGARRDDEPDDAPAGPGRTAVLEMLRDIVAAEDATAPLADESIAALLVGRGVTIARRTVAKLRSELGIPPRDLRRRFHRGS